MDFLVIAEDIPYYQWQIELLIESFKILIIIHVYVNKKGAYVTTPLHIYTLIC